MQLNGKFSVACGRRPACNEKSTMALVNAKTVNACSGIFFLP